MSIELINSSINSIGISGLQIFYDFNSYSAGGTVINSIPSGNAAYSGQIIGDAASFTGTSSGSGCFTNQYIEIQNSTGIQTEGFCIIFSQEKTGASAGVVYSDMDPQGPSGCEIGITDSNKLYFKNYVNGTPFYKTMDNIPCDKNIYAASVTLNGGVSLYRLSFNLLQPIPFIYEFTNSATDPIRYYDTESTSITLPAHTISNGASWRLGSGEYAYQGYMDYFLYFDKPLGSDTINRMARAIHSDATLVPAVTGTTRGAVTGYSFSGTGVSGIVGTASYISGTTIQSGFSTYKSGLPQTGCVGISGVVYRPYTGVSGVTNSQLLDQQLYRKTVNLSFDYSMSGTKTAGPLTNYRSSGAYWNFSGNSGTYNGVSATGDPGTLFGITGFSEVIITGYITGQTASLLGHSGNSGILYSGFSSTPLFASGTTYTGTGAYLSGGANEDSSYYPRALSQIGEVNKDYFHEITFDISGADKINQNAPISENFFYQKNIAVTTGTEDFSTNAAVNGVSQFTGHPSYSQSIYNLPQVDMISGFMSSGTDLFTVDILAQSDTVLYDTVESGIKNSLTITSLANYSLAPFTQFNVDEAQVFLNGIKIYSGIDYVDNGGFTPTGSVTGSTGVYFTYPNYSGSSMVTGSGATLLTVHNDAITPNGYVSFENGLRQPFGGIIEHAQNSDLLSGTRILNTPTNFYSMINGVERL